MNQDETDVPDHDTCVTWLMGRGLSIASGLSWTVPVTWGDLPRETKIEWIQTALRDEMDKDHVDTTTIRSLLDVLAMHTPPHWRHEFITTNWDYLLQREILDLGLKVQPAWLANSYVYPERLRVDHGPEFTSALFTAWCEASDIDLEFTQPGKPTQNAFVERFNGS
jgi:transposase InsO family protein